MKNPYDVLGVGKNATEEEIKKALRTLSKKWHPDSWANATDSEKEIANVKIREITEASNVLLDEQKRKAYDAGNFQLDHSEVPSWQEEVMDEFINSMRKVFFGDTFDKKRFNMSQQKSNIEGKIQKRRAKIYQIWGEPQQELNREQINFMCRPEYKMIEERFRIAERDLSNFLNKKSYQFMPKIYQKQVEKLQVHYDQLKQTLDEYRQKKADLEARQQEIHIGLENQLQNDPELVALHEELNVIETKLEELEKQNRR